MKITFARLVLMTGFMMTVLNGSLAYAGDKPSYIISLSSVPERPPIKYEISFIARFDNRVVLDTGTVGPSVDDVIAGSGTLWDKENVKVGRFDANTRITEKSNDGDKRLLFVTYTFGEGHNSIVILGVGSYSGNHGLLHQQVINNFAIVGGTGKFMAATGQCQITRVDQIDYRVTCKAFAPDY